MPSRHAPSPEAPLPVPRQEGTKEGTKRNHPIPNPSSRGKSEAKARQAQRRKLVAPMDQSLSLSPRPSAAAAMRQSTRSLLTGTGPASAASTASRRIHRHGINLPLPPSPVQLVSVLVSATMTRAILALQQAIGPPTTHHGVARQREPPADCLFLRVVVGCWQGKKTALLSANPTAQTLAIGPSCATGSGGGRGDAQ